MKYKVARLVLVAAALFAAARVQAETVTVDLSKVVNTPLEDDGIANNGAGGWTDEGVNDMYIYPPLETGRIRRNGYTFEMLDPAKNGGQAVIMLRGQVRAKDKPESVEIPVGGKVAPYIYFLQNAAGVPEKQPLNYVVANYEVSYTDGTHVSIPIRDGIEIRQWYAGSWWDNAEAASWPIFMGRNLYSQKWNKFIGVWAMQWKNPEPAKPVAKLVLKSAGTAVAVVFAVTLSDQDFRADPAGIKTHFGRVEGAPAGYFRKKEELERAGICAAAEKAGHLQGLRKVELIRPDLLAVTVDGALAGIGAGPGTEVVEKEQVPEVFQVRGGDGQPLAITKVGRQSYEFWNGNVGPIPQVTLYWHTFYLQLAKPLQAGQRYTVAVRDIPERLKSAAEFVFEPATTRSPIFKINQVAYSARISTRYAYLGWWAGDLGKVDYADFKSYEVVDDATGATVIKGDLVLRLANDASSGEDVYEMDLSALTPGQYHVMVPGLGRSDSFGVGGKGFRELYYHTMRAFYHQRAGTALDAKYTEYPRPATFVQAYESGYMVGNSGYLPKPNEAIREFHGGYHDAGDDDVFSMHLRATAQAMIAYEAFPTLFKDGDLRLPESGNGIPDLLDEAAWGLSFYHDTQLEDGAIYFGRGNDQDAIRGIQQSTGKRPAFGLLPPQNNSASEYAAVAAQFSRLIRPFDAKKADDYAQSARRAYQWAKTHPDAKPDPRAGNALFLAYAASELFRTTGDPEIHREFLEMNRQKAIAAVHWALQGTAWLVRASYLLSERPETDPAIQKEFLELFRKDAENVLKRTLANSYRNGWGGRAGSWGELNGGGIQSFTCIITYLKTRDPHYLAAIGLNADFQLGANPLSKTFISGIGTRPPLHPQLNPMLYKGPEKTGDPAPGITVYGIGCGGPGMNDIRQSYPSQTPAYRCWRDIGAGTAENSSEFTITETIGSSALFYAFLYAMEEQK